MSDTPHHPADPDAATRAQAYLDALERVLPDDENITVVWENHGLIELTKTDFREVLAQRADARDRAEQLAEGAARHRRERDDALAERDTWKGRVLGLQDERDGLQRKLQVVEKQRDDWRDAWIKLEAEHATDAQETTT